MIQSYDAIICGAGPAGSAAARVLAGEGARVLILDRAEFPREKLCGGVLTKKSMLLIERIFGDRPEDLEAAGAVDAKAFEYAIRHFNEDMVAGRLDYPLHFAKRRVFDNRLLEQALAAGAEGRFGDGAADCEASDGLVRSCSGRNYAGRYIVGADGAASVIRRRVPLDKERWRENMATGIEAYIPGDMFPNPPEIPILNFGVINSGYGWVFPTGRGMVTGICGLTRRNRDFMACFRGYLKFLGLDEAVKASAHILPFGSFLEKPVHERVLLAGDAAGFTDCLLGEGIYYAMRSGEAAARAILRAMSGGPPVSRGYPEELAADVLGEIKATWIWRKVLFGHQKNMRPRWPLVPLMRAFRKRLSEMVQGDRSFKSGARRDLTGPA